MKDDQNKKPKHPAPGSDLSPAHKVIIIVLLFFSMILLFRACMTGEVPGRYGRTHKVFKGCAE